MSDVFTDQELADIQARASTLRERLDGATSPDRSARVDTALVARRRGRWQHLAAANDPARFSRRLRWDGISEADVLHVLGAVSPAAGVVPAPWTQTLVAAATAARNEGRHSHAQPWILKQHPIPFEGALVPFVRVAKAQLEERAPSYLRLFSPRARLTLERGLLVTLANLAFPTLQLERSIHTLRRAGPAASLTGALRRASATDGGLDYAAFVDEVLADGYRSLWLEYPVLGRTLATQVAQWVTAGTALAERLALDLPAIRETFGDCGQLVADLRLGISDPHNSGHRVVGVRFDSGLKVIYKPKDVGPDAAFATLLDWVNSHGGSLPLRVLRMLRGDGWGWMEFADATPCTDDQALHRYYRRAGMLLAVLHALRGTDCHLENVIACGDQPVLVDLETLLSPRLQTWSTDVSISDAARRAQARIDDSVMATDFLPRVIVAGSELLDISGLGAIRERPADVHELAHINTDAMRHVRRRAMLPAGTNSPTGTTATAPLGTFVDDMVSGFDEVTSVLASGGEALLSRIVTRSLLQDTSFRVVLRPTWLYASLRSRLTHPRYLRDGVDRSIELEALARALTTASEPPTLWPAFHAEVTAIEGLDIPFFTCRADRTSITSGGVVIDNVLMEPPVVSLRRRWTGLSGGRHEQVQVLRTAILATGSMDTPAPTDDPDPLPGPEPTAAQLLAEAARIAERLRTRAIRGTDGSVAWIGLLHAADEHRCQYQPLDHSLYGGMGGILFFLAAIDRVADVPSSTLVDDALDGWLPSLLDRHPASVTTRLGAADGLGSTIYLLACLGMWRGRMECWQGALQLARTRVTDLLGADQTFTVAGGTAGAALSLLALYRACGAGEALELAVDCGRRLREVSAAGPPGRSWPRGFAYGADGIALALHRLGETTAEASFRAAAESIWATADGTTGDSGWCTGAAGSLLGRLPAHPAALSPLVERVLAAGAQGPDTLCCGTMGRASALVTAAMRLQRPDLAVAARRRAGAVITRAGRDGTFRHFDRSHGPIDNLTLFRGDAGIGYAFLQLARPDALPCVLTLAAP